MSADKQRKLNSPLYLHFQEAGESEKTALRSIGHLVELGGEIYATVSGQIKWQDGVRAMAELARGYGIASGSSQTCKALMDPTVVTEKDITSAV